MTIVRVDDDGRIPIPKNLRDRFGDRYHLVDQHDSIKLIPTSKDPVQGLAETLAPLREHDLDELKQARTDQALEDIREPH